MGLSLSSQPVDRWLFGKLPALGDFVARGLDAATRDGLDQWLSGEMNAARERFPEDFEARYDIAPAWNFVHCDADGRWSGGALCASADRAGRRFPLLLCAPADDPAAAVKVSGGCLEALYGAFAGGWDAERLHGEEIAPVELPWEVAAPGWALIAEDGPFLTMPGLFPDGVLAAMAEAAEQ